MTTATMEREMAQEDMTVERAKILKRCICLVLMCSALGNSRKVDLKQIELRKRNKSADLLDESEEVKTDKGELSAAKHLLDNEDLKPPRAVINAAKDYLRSVAIPGHHVFGAGTYLVPLTLFKDVRARLQQFQLDLIVAVDTLAEKYPSMVEKRRAKLGDLFHIGDYLSVDEVRGEYQLTWSVVSFEAPDQLEAVDRAAYEEEVLKHQQQLDAAYDEVVMQLRANALDVMTELADRLKPGPDGKPKVLRGTALRDLQEFAALLPKRNIGDDGALTAAVAKVAAYAQGLTVDTLRDAPAVREALASVASSAVKELEKLVATGRGRGIALNGLK